LVSYSGCDTFAYDAYGNRVDPLKDVINDGLFYTGEQFDAESSQYYLRARYYNPLTGRFNRIDPIDGSLSDPQSLHKYLYCHANPVNGIDSSGLFFSLSSINFTVLIQATLVSLNVMGVVYHARNAVVSVVNLINAWSVGDFWAGLAYIAIAAMHGLGLVMNVAGICTGLKPPPSAGIPALALSGGGAASIDKIWTIVTSNPQLARWVVRTVGPIAFSAFIVFASKSSGASAEWHHKVSPETKKYDFKNHKLVKKAGWTEDTLRNDSRNGMLLYNHKGRHLDKYHQEVKRMLDEAYERVGTGGKIKAERELSKVLDRIEERIENKTLNPCSRDVWIGDD